MLFHKQVADLSHQLTMQDWPVKISWTFN